MTDGSYKKAFESAIAELISLSKQREEVKEQLEMLEDRIEKVRQGSLGLANLADVDFKDIKEKYPDLFDDQIDSRMGITEAVRAVLMSSDEILTPTEIRDRVFQLNPAIAGHKNPLASIHAILKRFTDRGLAMQGLDTDDKVTYGWVDTDDAEERIKKWFTNAEEALERWAKRKKEKRF